MTNTVSEDCWLSEEADKILHEAGSAHLAEDAHSTATMLEHQATQTVGTSPPSLETRLPGDDDDFSRILADFDSRRQEDTDEFLNASAAWQLNYPDTGLPLFGRWDRNVPFTEAQLLTWADNQPLATLQALVSNSRNLEGLTSQILSPSTSRAPVPGQLPEFEARPVQTTTYTTSTQLTSGNVSGTSQSSYKIRILAGTENISPAALALAQRSSDAHISTAPIPSNMPAANNISLTAASSTNSQLGAPWTRPFVPSTMRQEAEGSANFRPRPPPGIRYQGDLNSFSYVRQITGLPDAENCSLFVTGIPVNASAHDIFNTIHVGGIVALYINNPTATHSHKAAKIVFKTPGGAAQYITMIRSTPGLFIQARRVNAVYNRHGIRQHPQQLQSRVLVVTGPLHLMEFHFWDAYFRQWALFNWDNVGYTGPIVNGERTMYFAFERIDGQAQTCLSALLHDDNLKNLVRANYGPDPCDPA